MPQPRASIPRTSTSFSFLADTRRTTFAPILRWSHSSAVLEDRQDRGRHLSWAAAPDRGRRRAGTPPDLVAVGTEGSRERRGHVGRRLGGRGPEPDHVEKAGRPRRVLRSGAARAGKLIGITLPGPAREGRWRVTDDGNQQSAESEQLQPEPHHVTILPPRAIPHPDVRD